MKKRLILCCAARLLVLGVIIFAVSLLNACTKVPTNSPTKLDTPVVTLQDDVVTWSANLSADKFEISIDGHLSYIENTLTSKKLSDGQTFKIRAIGDGENFLTSDWSDSVTYVQSVPTYTITWKNGDVVLEIDTDVEEGKVPTFDGAEPTKEADKQYSYIFAGWTPEVVAASGDATYSAVFTPIINTYTVTWMNGDTILETDKDVEYGAIPTFDGAEPQKEPDAQFIYVFDGWSPIVNEVAGDITYMAQFEAVPNSYTIIWKNGDTELERDENVAYGATPSYDGAIPTKESTAQFTFTFSGWTPEINSVTESVTYQAQFTKAIRSYTVTFYSEDGSTVLDAVTVEYGSNVEYSKSTPIKNPSEVYTYVFEKWVTEQGGEVTDDLSNITGDRAVYASFKSFIRKVTVYIVTNNPDYGMVSVSTMNNVPYGSDIIVNGDTVSINGVTVTAQANTATAQFTYTFADWSADATVDHDTVITANFERSVNTYTVTWMNGDDVLEIDENVAYGTMPAYNGPTPTKVVDAEQVYAFSGWSPSVSVVTGDVTYNAQFSLSSNIYTVTFYDEDGETVLGVVAVKYGDSTIYPNQVPAKPPTVSSVFTFDKWVTELNGSEQADLGSITSNIEVYATYSSKPREYKVTFYDWDGSLLEEKSIAYGYPATAPMDPYREGYRFAGWDTAFDSIVEDVQIRATYVRQFTVMFVDYDDSIIDMQLVDYGYDAVQPQNPTRTHYAFIGWNTTFANVVSDLTVRAQYIRQYTVIFVDHDGTVLKTEVVNAGESATPPQNVERVGYTFVAWNQSYDNVTSNMEVVAVYEINKYNVTFVNPDGTILEVIPNVAYGTTVTSPAPLDVYFDWSTTKGYRFTKWTDWSIGDLIVQDTTIVAEYAEEITEPIVAIETVKLSKGATKVELSVYLCGSFEDIYGMSIKLHYAEQFVLNNDAVKINDQLTGCETALNKDQSVYELSWADGQGIDVNGRIEIMTLTFSVDKYIQPGEYSMGILTGSHIINGNLAKVFPIVVVGKVIIVTG